MSYYAKDCIQMFLIGLIPSLFIKQGVWCWAAVCIGRYFWIKADWDKHEKNQCKTREEFEAKGYHLPEQYFDENGNYIKKW